MYAPQMADRLRVSLSAHKEGLLSSMTANILDTFDFFSFEIFSFDCCV
jgi:hypothetical protein